MTLIVVIKNRAELDRCHVFLYKKTDSETERVLQLFSSLHFSLPALVEEVLGALERAPADLGDDAVVHVLLAQVLLGVEQRRLEVQVGVLLQHPPELVVDQGLDQRPGGREGGGKNKTVVGVCLTDRSIASLLGSRNFDTNRFEQSSDIVASTT